MTLKSQISDHNLPPPLLAHFNRIAEAPDAVPRLRWFIFDLAMRGKLVEQDPNDELASELLRCIHRDRKVCRKFARLDPAELESPLPPIPEGWAWTVVDQVAADNENAITDGPFGANLKTEHYISEPGYRVIRLQNIGRGRFRGEHRSYIDEARFERLSKHHVQPGDLVVAGLVDPLVRCCELPHDIGPALVKADCYRFSVHPQVSARFASYYLNSPIAQLFAAIHHHGMTLTRIGLGNFRRIPFPLPPLAEQYRIVAKVDELMALCDRLEAAQAERESRRDRLAAASLARISNPTSEISNSEFRNHARFHLQHLPRLTARPEQIRQLRQTILNLAVRGRLVPQDPNDEPATDLLKRIQAEKARLTREGLLRKEKPLQSVAADDAPFTIPASWNWARIGTCSLLTEYGTSVKSDHTENGVPVLKMGDIQGGRVILGGQKKVPREIEDLPQLFLKRFDLLYNRTNSAELVGKTGIYLGDDDAYTFASYNIRIRFLNDLTSPIYANLAMNAAFFRETQIIPELQQQCGQANVNGTKLRSMIIPLPPLAEQHRIVAKVDELLTLCDQLEAQLTATQTESRRLLEALLHEALHRPQSWN